MQGRPSQTWQLWQLWYAGVACRRATMTAAARYIDASGSKDRLQCSAPAVHGCST